jgi:phage/plasmid-like protein (TIGR03299 family)
VADEITRVGDLDKFFGRAPAWHGKGTIMDVDRSAREALEVIGGAFEVTLQPLTTESGLIIPDRAIVRSPILDDMQQRSFGVVGPEYNLVTPDDAVTIWDEHVARPVETMGMLGKYGQEFFLTTKLPEIDVRGEEVQNYLLGHFPMSPFKSAQAIVSPVCTVCANTLRLAESMAVQRLRVVHDRTVKARLAMWMSEMVNRAEAQTEALKEAFDVFAAHKVTSKQQKTVLEAAYPTPQEPIKNAPDSVMDGRWKQYEYARDSAERAKKHVVALFSGEARGSDLTARQGTMWGLYNAVTERENYRRGGNEQSRAMSILFPNTAQSRGAVMERSFQAGLAIVRKG